MPVPACRLCRGVRTVFLVGIAVVGILGGPPWTGVAPAAEGRTPDGADFYVAPNGNDQWSGTRPEPNAQQSDGPFASLERARDAVRRLRAKQAWQRPLVVMLRGGTYPRVKPLVLRPEDSGTEASPVVYTAQPGEKPVLSGGRVLREWQHEGSLWKVELPEVKAGSWYFRQLFVDGKRRPRTRFPKEGVFTVAGLPAKESGSWMGNLPDDKSEWGKRAIRFKPGDLRKDWPGFATLWDYNLYFREAAEPVEFMKYSFDQWKAKGLDQHSVIADPRFVDPANRNFALRPDSPALGLGFKPIDLSRVGPRAP